MKRAIELTMITTKDGGREKVCLLDEYTNIQVECPYHPSKHESFKMGVEMLKQLLADHTKMLQREPRRRMRR